MRKLLTLIRTSRLAATAAAALLAIVALAPAALSRTLPFQQAQVAGQVIEKDDCKNGGWRTFNVFKNQGDCVSYVATGGRNQPAGPTSTTVAGPTTTTLAPTTTTTVAPTTTTTVAGNRPTTKEDCKKGGWVAYGVFKNQGDCVSWIATGGSNPPAGP